MAKKVHKMQVSHIGKNTYRNLGISFCGWRKVVLSNIDAEVTCEECKARIKEKEKLVVKNF